MLKLMKYEFRKQMFTKFIMLFLAGLLEVFFLFGVFTENGDRVAIASALFIFLAIGSVLFVSFECIITYSQDMKTKCSYMLFMTPHTSYAIIGAKTLATIVQILAVSLAYILIGLGDFVILLAKSDELSNLVDYLSEMFHIDITAGSFILGTLTAVSSWICVVLFAFLAITISTTFLANKRGKALVSFIIFLVITYIQSKVTNLVIDSAIPFTRTDYILNIVITVIFAAMSYIATSYMLEKKVSL